MWRGSPTMTSFSRNMMKKSDIDRLEHQGCYSDDWSLVTISQKTDLGKIRNVFFRGHVSIGADAEIVNVPGGLKNVRIGNNVRINNVAKIEKSEGATFGIGTVVSVLDETGSRPVRIYPGISAQLAALAARMPEYAARTLDPIIQKHIANLPDIPEIGDSAVILDCGPIIDVRIWNGVRVEGASRLRNCSIVSNSENVGASAYVGHGTDAENCIIEDARIGGGSFLRNTYVGQGAVVDKGFTSHDSLCFSNCTMENGEACAVLAGPFTVSMHKSTLLIACQTAFLNAGSGTNMSNHMYKLGPVHWGVLERGVKSSSNSYLMHGSRIGAFSLLMGDHRNHPDSSEFPFSYVIGDARGRTVLVPGAMLRSYGIVRDEKKWQSRDRRRNLGLKNFNDRIDPGIFNPYTAGLMADAIDICARLLSDASDIDDFIVYKGMKISLNSLSKGKDLYELALCKYLNTISGGASSLAAAGDSEGEKWLDLNGQIIPESRVRKAMEAGSLEEIEEVFDKAARDRDKLERNWISGRLGRYLADRERLAVKAAEYDSILEKDRLDSIRKVSEEQAMLSLF